MRNLRWIFLGLFLALSAALFLVYLANDPGWNALAWGVAALLFVASQALFIFGAGTWDLGRPVRKIHLWIPITVATILFAVLSAGFVLALSELFRWKLDTPGSEVLPVIVVWSALIGSWIVWGVLLWIYTYRVDRFRALHRMTSWLFLGSIAELLAAVPAHILVTRRPGCLLGLATGAALIAGLAVMVWTFGPMVILLVLRNRYHRERAQRRQKISDAAAGNTGANPP